MLDYNKAVDFSALYDVEKFAIVTEGYASVRLTAATAHVRMGKHPVATKHVTHAGRNKTDGAYTVKKVLAQ